MFSPYKGGTTYQLDPIVPVRPPKKDYMKELDGLISRSLFGLK
jgi:hypothetical protein